MSDKSNDKNVETDNKNGETDSNNELLTLTPRVLEGDEKDRIEPYLSRLKQAIDQKGIRNIALTGNYGSGKSTILKTFQKEYSDYNYLLISLASFKEIKKNEKDKENDGSGKRKPQKRGQHKLKADFEQKLEISILQQIFYKVSADKIPDSRFKRIRDFDNEKTTKFIAYSAVWIICAFLLFGFDYIDDLNPRNWDINKSISWIALGSSLIFIVGIYYLMKFVFRSFSNSKINKFSIKGEIEFGETSVFNHYLDEIIYFFEKTEYNVVVFEDIDRFDTTSIFTKLRELNNLINNCDLISREITFVYAVKDTLFKDKTERVKFFDFIIPVIPFVNSKNASEQLNKLIKKYNLSDKLSNRFVSELISFIHDIDMRLLINTFHEYHVFKDNIADDDISHEELFSIIVYKNLYPEDFSSLYRKEGKLYDVINKRDEHVITLTEEQRAKIPLFGEEIEELEKHNHVQIKELRAVYILKLLEELPNNINQILLDNTKVDIYRLIDDEYFNKFQLSKDIKYIQPGYSSLRSGLSFDQIENLVNNKLTYSEREGLIEGSNNNKMNSIKNQIMVLKRKIGDIKKLSLAEIFGKMETDEVFGDFKENDLVRFLLIGGYLNENYSDYISLFHGQDLTKKEYKFRNAIKSLREPDFKFQLTNHYNFINDLHVRYFSKRQILNYDIVEYLISDSTKNIFPEKRATFYSSLENQESVYFEFIFGFIEAKANCRKVFFTNLIKYRKSFWDELFHREKIPDEKILEIVKYLFEFPKAEDLQKLDNVESLNGYIETLKNPISFGASLQSKKRLQEFIINQSVKFKEIETPDNHSNSFFGFVFENNSYEINYLNVITILKNKLSEFVEGDIQKAIYSYISELELTYLKEYLEENINEFVSKVLLHENKSHSESEETLITLLNNEGLKSHFKAELIDIQKHKISSLDRLINYEVKEIVTSANKIKPTWNNVYHYYDQLDESFLNETFISFLNKKENYVELSEKSVFDVKGVDEKLLLKFRDDLLYCAKLDLKAYKNLLKSLLPIDSVVYSQISQEMAEILLEENILNLSSHNFDGLKSIEGSLHISLIEKNIQELVENTITLSFDQEDWYSILNSKNITISHKRELLFYLTIDNLSYIKVAEKVIDLHPKQKIESYGFDKIKVLLSHGVSIKKRIALLLNYMNDFSDEQLKAIVSQFGEDYADLFGLYKSPTFPNNNAHFEFLKELDNRGIISSFSKSGDVIRAHCRRKK